MHLVERFSLEAGQPIKKPFVLEKFYPLPFNKYIIFQPQSKYDSKNYSHWQEVIDIISPILKSAGIEIVQVGGPNEKAYNGCFHTQGKTNFGNLAYLISNSLLVFGCDSVSNHIASGLGKKIVAIYSNNYLNCVKPYWTNKEDCVLLEPERNGNKPSFSEQEFPKTINTIKPEQIAQPVIEFLGLKFDWGYETVFFGDSYINSQIVEMVPDIAINTQALGLDNIIIRMDYLFNEEVLKNQLSISTCTIVTDKPINKELLKAFRPRIKQLIYKVNNDNDIQFVDFIHTLGINYELMSELSEEELNKYKLNYLDYRPIIRKNVAKSLSETPFPHIPAHELFYRSNKTTLGNQKIHPSRAAWQKGPPIADLSHPIQPVIDSPDFWAELDFFYILRRKLPQIA